MKAADTLGTGGVLAIVQPSLMLISMAQCILTAAQNHGAAFLLCAGFGTKIQVRAIKCLVFLLMGEKELASSVGAGRYRLKLSYL